MRTWWDQLTTFTAWCISKPFRTSKIVSMHLFMFSEHCLVCVGVHPSRPINLGTRQPSNGSIANSPKFFQGWTLVGQPDVKICFPPKPNKNLSIQSSESSAEVKFMLMFICCQNVNLRRKKSPWWLYHLLVGPHVETLVYNAFVRCKKCHGQWGCVV